MRQLAFYEIEYLLKNFEEYIDEEEKAYKKQQTQQTQQQKQYQQTQTKVQTPKIGSDYGGFKIPKLAIPKINIPKVNF